MRLLFVVPYVPSPIYIRPYALLRTLAGRGHTIRLLTLGSRHENQANIRALEEAGVQVDVFPLPRWYALWNAGRALPSHWPLQASYCWQPRLWQTLQNICQTSNGFPPFDVLHVEHLRGVQYALGVERTSPNLPIIWDSVDCISHLFRQAAGKSRSFFGQWVTRLEAPRTARLERRLLHHFDHILVTSPADKQAYKDLLPERNAQTPIHIVPNGVALDEFYPNPNQPRAPHTLVVSGKMSYHANITMVRDLVEKIMPLVWRAQPEVRLQIVGKDPPAIIQGFGNDPRIEVTGTVPHIRPYLQQTTLAIAPLVYGAGIQNKVLEAMACGTPVVCTSRAVSALQVENGRHVVIADTHHDFARALLTLLKQPERRALIGQAGLAYVERYHRWDAIASQVEAIYQQAQVSRIKSPPPIKRTISSRPSGEQA